jgi:hypothetical protein
MKENNKTANNKKKNEKMYLGNNKMTYENRALLIIE